jgi:hypothetical protein
MRALWSSARSAGWRRLAPLRSSMARRGGPARRSPADSGIGRLEVRHCRLSCGFMPALRRIGRWGHVEGQAPRSSFFIGSIDAPDVPIGVIDLYLPRRGFFIRQGRAAQPLADPWLMVPVLRSRRSGIAPRAARIETDAPAAAATAPALVRQRRQLGCTCQVPSRDLTKP